MDLQINYNMPQCEASEQALIWSMLADEDIIQYVELKKEDFYDVNLGRLYNLCKNIKKRGGSVDLIVVNDYLQNNNLVSKVWWFEFLADLAEKGHSFRYKEYERIIKDNSIRRNIIGYANKMRDKAMDKSVEAEESIKAIQGVHEIIFDVKDKWSGVIALSDKFSEIREQYNKHWALGYSSSIKEVDKYTQWIVIWSVFMIAAYSNVWKSSLAYLYVCKLLKRGKTVTFFSLEVTEWILMSHLLRCYYNKTIEEVMHPDFVYDFEDFQNLTIYDNKRKMGDIEKIVKATTPDVVFIDFVQNVDIEGGGEYEKMTNAAIRIQKMAIENKVTVFNISQVNNTSKDTKQNMQPKGSGALFASSDVILWIYRDNGELKASLVKNKYWPFDKSFLINADFERLQFGITEDFWWESTHYLL